MDALKTVFATITQVVEIIRGFFEKIMGMFKAEDESAGE